MVKKAQDQVVWSDIVEGLMLFQELKAMNKTTMLRPK